MMADFLHEIIKKREEHTRISTMINNQDVWANEEVMEPIPVWEQELMREVARQWTDPAGVAGQWIPPAGEEPF
jgi:hypothetical protein